MPTAAATRRVEVATDAPEVAPVAAPPVIAMPSDGRIALTIGVTGHRTLACADLHLYRRAIEAFFDDLQARLPHTPIRLLSPLAEGADRLPVEIALARGHEVFAALPFARDDYERDFGERAPAFHALVARMPADNVFVVSPAEATSGGAVDPRDRQYERVGHFVASHCHVLLALWDGIPTELPGGTGEVVHYKLAGRNPHVASASELLELPDSGPVAWIKVRRNDDEVAHGDPSPGTLRWLHPDGRSTAQLDAIHRRIDDFNRLASTLPDAHAPSPLVPLTASPDAERRRIATLFARADALSIRYRKLGDRVLKVLIALGVVMTLAYEAYSRVLPVRAMLGVYLGAFALVCVVYVWHRRIGALEKHLDYRALAEGLRVRSFWSLTGVPTVVTDVYLRKQNDELQWIREALRPHAPARGHAFVDTAFVRDAWVDDQLAYFQRSARRLNRTARWAKLASLGFFAAGIVKTAVLFVAWDHVEALGGFGHWSIVTVGSLPIVGALIDALSDSMGYAARSKQHAILAGFFSRAAAAYRELEARPGRATAELRTLVERLGREALIENEDWLTLRRERPMVLPDDASPVDDRDATPTT